MTTTVHTGAHDETIHDEDRAKATAKLHGVGFRITTDDTGWIAEYTAGYHRIRVESVPGGWIVSHVRVAGSFERVKTAEHRETLTEATRLAANMTAALNNRLRLVGSVAGPLLAELRRTS